jgi:hypothetical protein
MHQTSKENAAVQKETTYSAQTGGEGYRLAKLTSQVFLFSGGGPLRGPAAGAGYASFLLSSVRPAWGWMIGLLFIVRRAAEPLPSAPARGHRGHGVDRLVLADRQADSRDD